VSRAELLARYAAGPAVVRAALAEAGADLDATPAGGGWSPRQVVHHLADSETTSGIRLRRLLAEESPVIEGYDEELFARTLRYDRPVARSLALFEAVRASALELLELLDESAWARAGTHSESGPYSVSRWLEIYAEHAHEHAAQIRQAIRGGSAG
jgi:hypothetical protein